jgi:hypothetical protein
MVRMLSWRLPAFRLPCFIFVSFLLRSPDGAQRNPGTAVKLIISLPDFAFAPSGLLAQSVIEPKPVLPPGREQNFGVTRSKTLGVFCPCRAANLGCKNRIARTRTLAS